MVTRRCLGILAAAICLIGVVIAMPQMSPVARADSLPNGYSITCTPNGSQLLCNISGCPRVHEQEAGDVVHVTFNNGDQRELAKSCNNTTTTDFNNLGSPPYKISVQGCRKHDESSDDCGAWSDYTYTPPAQAQPQAPAQAPAPPQQVTCPQGSPTPQAASLGQCAPVPPTNCPAGSVSSTVPAGQQCAAPTDAIAMTISQSGINAHAAITNNSSLPAQCTYTATKTGGLGPQTVTKTVSVPANGTGTITDMLWPPPFTTYDAVVKCTAQYNGTQTSIGQASQTVSG